MAKIDLEQQLQLNKDAAEHGDVIRATIAALRALRRQGLSERQYTLASPYGRHVDLPASNQKKVSGIRRSKVSLS